MQNVCKFTFPLFQKQGMQIDQEFRVKIQDNYKMRSFDILFFCFPTFYNLGDSNYLSPFV